MKSTPIISRVIPATVRRWILVARVVPLTNNSRQTDIIAVMPDCNAHGLDPNWVEPEADQV